MTALIVIGVICLIIMINAPGLLGNMMIWIVAIAVIIGVSCWLGIGGFVLAAPIVVWIAYLTSSDRSQQINRQEQIRLAARRRAGLKWFQ